MMSILLLVVVSVILAFYVYVKKCYNYWDNRGVVTVHTNFFFGFAFDVLKGACSFAEMCENVCKKAKPNEPYFGTYLLWKPVLFAQDPELIYHILVRDSDHFEFRYKIPIQRGPFNDSLDALGGKEWKITRKKLSPAFTSSKILKHYRSIEESAEILIERYFR